MDNMKNNVNLQRNVIIVMVSVVILVVGFYFCFFNDGISQDSNSWSNFGNYINGVLMPVLTAINIYVFIKLTTEVSKLEERRSENAMSKENERIERELQHEREMLLLQLRKQELDVFLKQMNRIFDNSPDSKVIESLQQVADYLQSFSETGLKWFNLQKYEKTRNEINSLWVKLNKYIINIKDKKDFDPELFNKIYDTKAKLTTTLVEATLNTIPKS